MQDDIIEFRNALQLKTALLYDKPRLVPGQFDLAVVPNHVRFENSAEGIRHVINLAEACKYLHYVSGFAEHADWVRRAFAGCWRGLGNGFYQSRIRIPRIGIMPSKAMMTNAVGGVKRQIDALYKYLPAYGFELNDADPDFVHAHATFLHERMAVYTNHGLYPWNTQDRMQQRQNNEIKLNIASARRVIAVSRLAPDVFEPILHAKAITIPNGIDLDEFKDIPRGQFIQQYSMPGPYFLWAKVTMNEVCDPKPGQVLANMMLDQPFVFTFIDGLMSPNIRVTGRLTYEQAKLALADCSVLLATTTENFSVQVLEAMALGKPVLAFNTGGNREAIIHKETGYLAVDQDDLYYGAKFCLENAEALGTRARQVVASRYRWDRHIIPKIAKVYQSAIAERTNELKQPLVTVVITHYNMAQWLPEAIDSVLAQTFTDWELIVVDDGSTKPGFDDVMARYTDPRIKVVKQPNQGVAAARNNGIAAGTGKYVCCLDADDTIKPPFLAQLLVAMETHTGCGIAYCDFELFGAAEGIIKMQPYSFEELKRHNIIPCCNLFRRTAWERTGGYRELIAWEDYELWLHISKLGYLGTYIPGAWFRYRKKGSEGRDAAGQGREREIRAQFVALHPDIYPAKIVVVIPTYNHERYLADSIGSVLDQTLQDFEIVVVDDGSKHPEAVDAACAKFKDGRIRVIHHPKNLGLAEARNTGIRSSNAPLIFTLDADDIIKPTCLQEMYNLLLAQHDIDIAYCDVELFGFVSKILLTPEYDFEQLLIRNLFCCASLYRRKVFDDCGGYKANMHYGWEDYEFWVNAGKLGHCGARVPKALFKYRRDRKSMIVESHDHVAEMRRQLHANHPDLYYEGRRPVACCGRRPRHVTNAHLEPMTVEPTVGQSPLVEVAYVGETPIAIRGEVTKATYEFAPLTVRLVDARDTDVLLQSPYFKLVDETSEARLAESRT